MRSKGPKVSKGRPESPLVASAEAKSPVRRKKQGSIFSLPSISNLFLVGGFVRLRADEVLSPRGKVPKGRRGRPKGACGMAAPGPPVAKQQCTASLAGARPAGLTAYLGGPLSPSAQSIPPPAFGRRSIPGVVARARSNRNPPGPRGIAALYAAGYGEQQENPTRIG